MSKLLTTATSIILFSICSFFTNNEKNFSVNATITGLEEGTKVMLLDAATNGVLDSAFVNQQKFTFLGKTTVEPKDYILYIPLESGMKYTYLFIANEKVEVRGDINDFPNNLTVEGSVHHDLKRKYDKDIAAYDQKMGVEMHKTEEIKKLNKWNDSLQKIYFEDNGILYKIDKTKLEAEKRFIKQNANTYFALQVLKYKKNQYTDKELKKAFSTFDKKLQLSTNGKAIQTYLDNPAIEKGDKYADFIAKNKSGKNKKFSENFDGLKFVLLEFSTPTCPNSRAAMPMLQELNKSLKDKINIVTYYTENNKEHFDYLTSLENNNWDFLWTENGTNGIPYQRYRVNSTPTYFLFTPKGKLIERWSGYKKGNYDDTLIKIKELMKTN